MRVGLGNLTRSLVPATYKPSKRRPKLRSPVGRHSIASSANEVPDPNDAHITNLGSAATF